MKKRLIRVILTVLLAAVCLALPFAATAGAVMTAPVQYDDTFLAGLADKVELLKTVGSPRIVLIGGSSLVFGLDSALLESYTGMPVVDFGLYATIGTKAMLDLSRPYIREGDYIVLCPETDAQTYSLYYNGKSMWQALDCDYSMLKDVGFDNLGRLLADLPEFAKEKLSFVRRGEKPAPTGIYAHSSFDEYGDIGVERPYNEMPANCDLSQPIRLSPDIIADDFLPYLNDYAAYARSKGAKVAFSFCPINASAVDTTDEEQETFYFTLGKELDFPIISDLDDYILAAEYFYDSNFHLNTRGAKLRTALLADDINRALGVTEYIETVKFTPPKRPEDYFAKQVTDDDNAKYYTFEDCDGGLKIVGLTEEGQSQTVLTIPRAHDYKAVVTLGDNALSSSKALTTLVIPENALIRSLEPDSLANCPTLRRIETKAHPGDLSAGSAVLAKMPKDCCFYIPDSMYGEYATDYFWSSLMQYIRTVE